MSLKHLNPAIIIYRRAPDEKDLSEELISLVTSCGYTPIEIFKQIRPMSVKYNLGRGKLLEIKDEIKKRLGRSPDEGESILLAVQAKYEKNKMWYIV